MQPTIMACEVFLFCIGYLFESPAESKFRVAEKLFIPTCDSNWYSKEYVDELQKFYQEERNSLKQKIESNNIEADLAKLQLIQEIDQIK